MDRTKHCIILALSFLLASCGQVGVITGGEIDNKAPKPLTEEMEPAMASLNTFPETIRIPFDEYIALNKPAENISVSPKDVTLDYQVKGRSLVLQLKEGSWKKNTTYSISLNRAVKDITEGNDSILFYVFSTGSYIDSLKCSFIVRNSYDKSAQDDITVGLFDKPLTSDTSNVTPRYFSSTDKEGTVNFNYLKAGDYFVYAFNDENKNSQLDPGENRGKLKSTIRPQAVDTILDTIYMMPPEVGELRVLSNEFISPGLWCIGFNKPVNKSDSIIYLGSNLINYLWSQKRDSLTFYLENELSGSESFILKGDSVDTISKRFFFKEKPEISFQTNLKNKNLRFGDTLSLVWNDPVEALDSTKVRCLISVDSVESIIHPVFEFSRKDHLKIHGFDRKSSKDVSITFLPTSIKGYNSVLSDTLMLEFKLGEKKDLGALIFSLDTIPPNGLLILENSKGEEIRRKTLTNEDQIKFVNLPPGNYTYRILLDTNKNGEWDTGNIFKDIEPEKVLFFKSSSVVRANWDVEVSLDIQSKLR